MLGLTGVLAAQERAAKWRPVPGLAAAQPLPVPLPRARSADSGTGAVFLGQGPERRMLWMQDGKLREATLRPPGNGGASQPPDIGDAPPSSMQLGDFDGDGNDDVIVPSLPGITIVQLDGSDRVIPDPRPVLTPGRDARWFSGRAFDWFGDGHAALLFVDGSRVVARRDLAKPDTVVLVDLGRANVPADTTFAGTAGDFDLDGMPDLVLALPERGLVWCRNEGTRKAPLFSAPIALWPAEPGVLVTSVSLFPIDDDPWLDVVLGTACRALEGPGEIAVRVPWLRTAAEDNELRALEAQVAPNAAPRLPDNLAPRNNGGDPFAKLIERKRLTERIDALRWRVEQWTARAPLVHYRTRR